MLVQNSKFHRISWNEAKVRLKNPVSMSNKYVIVIVIVNHSKMLGLILAIVDPI
jgi:hypothetical protein